MSESGSVMLSCNHCCSVDLILFQKCSLAQKTPCTKSLAAIAHNITAMGSVWLRVHRQILGPMLKVYKDIKREPNFIKSSTYT